MQIESWSFGAMNSGSAGIGTGMGTGKASLQDFHFVIQNGKASPKLFLACVNGDHKNEGVLVCRKTGGAGSPYTYLKITFNQLVISSFQTGGSNGSSTLPMEQISFNFTKITIEQFEQDTASGKVTACGTAIYDAKQVKGTAG
jgi:type VI secretion system secreted protein Hcp